jgi:hypothetical protein
MSHIIHTFSGTTHDSRYVIKIERTALKITDYKSLDGTVLGIKIDSLDSHTAFVAQDKTDSSKGIDVNKFHEMIGHCGVDPLKKTVQVHGLKLKGNFKVCEDCAVAKARQKNLNKDWKGESQVPGERVYLDISSIRVESYGVS